MSSLPSPPLSTPFCADRSSNLRCLHAAVPPRRHATLPYTPRIGGSHTYNDVAQSRPRNDTFTFPCRSTQCAPPPPLLFSGLKNHSHRTAIDVPKTYLHTDELPPQGNLLLMDYNPHHEDRQASVLHGPARQWRPRRAFGSSRTSSHSRKTRNLLPPITHPNTSSPTSPTFPLSFRSPVRHNIQTPRQ